MSGTVDPGTSPGDEMADIGGFRSDRFQRHRLGERLLTLNSYPLKNQKMRKLFDSSAERRSLILRSIYALCILGATYNHWAAIYLHGIFWDHGGFPRSSTTFWTTLALLDPTAAILLFWRPNTGIAATMAIIVADVIHNVWIEARYFPPLLHGLAGAPQVIEQIVFMIFAVATAPFAWTRKIGFAA